MNTLLLTVVSYLCGSVPTGYWVVKTLKGIDLRQVGSGSTGTTNVLRTAGKTAAAFVFFVDIAKGYVPVWFSIYALDRGILGLPEQLCQWAPFVVAAAALLGHSKSIFLNFQGGKSAATAFGTTLAMNLPASLTSFGIFMALVVTFRFVSLASIIAVGSSALVMHAFHGRISYTTYCALGGLYVILRHKANMIRLIKGTEPRIGQKLGEAAKASPEPGEKSDSSGEPSRNL